MPLLPGLDGGPVHLFLHNQHITHRPDNCDWCIPPSLQCSANICVNNPTDSPFEAGRIQERLSLGVRVPVRTAYPLYTVISHNWLCQNNRENDTVMATMTHDIIPALISLPCLCSVITSTYRTFIFYPPFKRRRRRNATAQRLSGITYIIISGRWVVVVVLMGESYCVQDCKGAKTGPLLL